MVGGCVPLIASPLVLGGHFVSNRGLRRCTATSHIPCSVKFDVSRRALHRSCVVACRICLYGVLSRGCHFAGLDEDFRGEGVLWAVGGCFRGLAGQARHARRRAAERCDSASKFLDGGDCCSACFGSERATVDTDRSSAGGLLWRLAKKAAFLQGGGSSQLFVDVDPFAPVQQGQGSMAQSSGGSAAATGSCAPAGRKLKLSSLVDQGDDTEIGGASSKQVAAWHQQYITVMGAPPQEEEEPSADQLQALYHRTVVLGNAPRVDHAVWGPFGRKTTRANKFRTWIPTSDGSYISKELPGPENFQQWLSSWRVFEAAAIMLDLISMAALALYEKAIERLTHLWPSAWDLVVAADIERIRRSCEVLRAEAVVCMLQARRCGHRVLGRAGSPSSGGVGGGGLPGRTVGAGRESDRVASARRSAGARASGGGASVGPTKAARGDQAAAGGGGAGASAVAGLEAGEGRHGRLGRGLSRQGHEHGQHRQEGQVGPALEDARRQGDLLQLERQAGQVRRRGSRQAVSVGQGACLPKVPQRRAPFRGVPAVGQGSAVTPAGVQGDGAASRSCPNAEEDCISVEALSKEGKIISQRRRPAEGGEQVQPLVRVGRFGSVLVRQQLAELSWKGSRAGRFGLSGLPWGHAWASQGGQVDPRPAARRLGGGSRVPVLCQVAPRSAEVADNFGQKDFEGPSQEWS